MKAKMSFVDLIGWLWDNCKDHLFFLCEKLKPQAIVCVLGGADSILLTKIQILGYVYWAQWAI